MQITLRPEHEEFIAQTLRDGVCESSDETIWRALDLLRQEEWLSDSRGSIQIQIQRGLAELDRGEGIPEDELDAYLERLKSEPE